MKFPILGFFEELIMVDETRRCLGTRQVPYEPGRLLGANGARQVTITEPFILQRGHKTVNYKASHKRPLTVLTMLQMLNGRAAEEHEHVDGPYYSTTTRQVYGVPGFTGWP